MIMEREDFSNPTWRIPTPTRKDYGIAIIGCGGIVNYAHLPAYRSAQFNVVAVYDRDLEVAQATATEFGIDRVAGSIEELLTVDGIDIVDIAVPPWVQPEIVVQVAPAGKHMLCQKPFALDLGSARAQIAAADAAGVKQAVNQQMRWSAGIAASRSLIHAGAIGTPTEAQVQVSVSTPWHLWPWLAQAPRLEVNYHSIHYLDALRSMVGDPIAVTSVHGRYAEQGAVKGETKTVTVLEYRDGLQSLIAVNHFNQHAEPYAEFRVLGTDGALEGTIGLMYNYPVGRPDTLELRRGELESPVEYSFDTMWIPDAFAGPMGDLMDAITEDRKPETNSRDNLVTLKLVEASYVSAAEGRRVLLSEFDSEGDGDG